MQNVEKIMLIGIKKLISYGEKKNVDPRSPGLFHLPKRVVLPNKK